MNNNPTYRNCPARMDMPIFFSDFRPASCGADLQIRLQNNITNSFDYRAFLQNNAEKIIEYNRAYATRKNQCGPCDAPKVVWSASGPLYPMTPSNA